MLGDPLGEPPVRREELRARLLEGQQVLLEPGVAALHVRQPRALFARAEQQHVLLHAKVDSDDLMHHVSKHNTINAIYTRVSELSRSLSYLSTLSVST